MEKLSYNEQVNIICDKIDNKEIGFLIRCFIGFFLLGVCMGLCIAILLILITNK